MKSKLSIQNLTLIAFFTVRRVRSQECAEDASSDSDWPNCTAANTAFCTGDIIFRCFYPYGHACPGNCMDNLDEQYRDGTCWESYPGAGDGQCTAECVSVTAKNGSTFDPLVRITRLQLEKSGIHLTASQGCNQNGTSLTVSTSLGTTTSTPSGSATTPRATTTTTPAISSSPKTNAGSLRERPTYREALTIPGAIVLVAYMLYSKW